MGTPQKVWIDTDFGSDSDDAIALLLALVSPELDVQGISVVGRQSFVRALMVQAFVNAAGRPDISVYPGSDAPTVPPAALNANTAAMATTPPASAPVLLQQSGAYQFNWFGTAVQGVEGVGVWASPPDTTAAGTAIANAYASPSDVSLLAIGPFTNIYQALAKSAAPVGFGAPPIAANVPAIYTMGLHFHPTAFNSAFISAAVDYNLAADTVSALAVLDTFAPIGSSNSRMNFVTADLTLQTWLTTSHLALLTAAGATYPVLAMLSQMITAWSAKQAQLFGYTIGTAPTQIDNAGFLHDPLTVAASFGAVDPATGAPFVQFEPQNVELVLDTTSHVRVISHPQAAPKATRLLACSEPVSPATPAGNTAFADFVVGRLLNPPAPWPTTAPAIVPAAWPASFTRG
jgi:inosine-uridine nucleoside N-ribohydrolase